MVQEYWGTLSIYDHRDPIFVTSLILFDRIIIPIPDKAIDALTVEEIDQLSADAAFLQSNGAAIIYNFKESEFRNWQDDVIREVLTVKKSDSLYDTRLMLQTKAEDFKPKDVYEITAIPVYGAREKFTDIYTKINPLPQKNLLLELSQFISVPKDKSSLGDIIDLRQRDTFTSALRALREWQLEKLPKVVEAGSEKEVLLAKEEFEFMLKRYEEEISKGRFDKKKVVITSLLALGALFSAAAGEVTTAIALMSGAAPNLFDLKESFSPSWKDLRDTKFEPAGVIYEANRLLH